jgi:hypothetical protein
MSGNFDMVYLQLKFQQSQGTVMRKYQFNRMPAIILRNKNMGKINIQFWPKHLPDNKMKGRKPRFPAILIDLVIIPILRCAINLAGN